MPQIGVGSVKHITRLFILFILSYLFQDTFDMQILMARSVKHCINFMEAKQEDLHRLDIIHK